MHSTSDDDSSRIDVHPGLQFVHDGVLWQVVRFAAPKYSPYTTGDEFGVWCKVISGSPDASAQASMVEGEVEWIGLHLMDVVAQRQVMTYGDKVEANGCELSRRNMTLAELTDAVIALNDGKDPDIRNGLDKFPETVMSLIGEASVLVYRLNKAIKHGRPQDGGYRNKLRGELTDKYAEVLIMMAEMIAFHCEEDLDSSVRVMVRAMADRCGADIPDGV